RMSDQAIEERHPLGRRAGTVAADEAPQNLRGLGIHDAREIKQHGEGHGTPSVVGYLSAMDMPSRVNAAFRLALGPGLGHVAQILVDGSRDHVEIQAL